MTASDNSKPEAKPLSKRLKQWFTGLAIIAFAVVVPAFMLLLMFEWQDPQWKTCEVIAAESSKGNRFNTSEWLIGIDTKDCGRVVYSVGVNEENVHELAASFDPRAYDFKFGLSSRLAADGWLPFVAATAQDYRQSY